MKYEAPTETAFRVALKSTRVHVFLFIAMIATITFTAIEYAFPTMISRRFYIKDYDAFFVAGQMFWEGRLADAYFAETLFPAQADIRGSQSFMPWTYPPHFNIMTAILAIMPVWLGYTAFTGITLLFYVILLRSITPTLFAVVLIFTFPAVIICIRTGQNGFLVAGLMCYFVSNFERSQFRAAISLALLSIKPHFLPLLYLVTAIRGQRLVALGGILGTAIMLLSATLLFGFTIWPSFQNAVHESSVFLHEGFYPLFRMTSLYSALHTLGVSPKVAFASQAILSLLAIGAVLFAKMKNWPRHHLLAVSVMGTLFISPYSYDYDLQILGVALALLMQDLWERASPKQLLILLAGCWLSSASLILSWRDETSQLDIRNEHLALNFWFLLSICLYSLRIVRTGETHES